MTPASFRLEVTGGVAVVTLDRPARLNALTFEAYAELRDFFGAAEEDGAIRAVVLTGAGRAFCSGGDVHDIVGKLVDMDPQQQLAFTRLTSDVVLAMRQLRKPIVAAVNGVAAGAGAALAVAADLRLASTEARFGFVFPRIGLSGADMGMTWLLPRVVGMGRAADLLMRGELIDADAAERMGLVNHVVHAERLLGDAFALAERLAGGPGFALGATKRMLDASARMDLPGALAAEAEAQQICMQHPDFREAYRAFVERRPPRFSGA